jgi:hypothetical protein
MFLAVHRMKESNIGDRSSCPADYFELGPTERMDIYDIDSISTEEIRAKYAAVVIGGGGLFYFDQLMVRILDWAIPCIGWGIGTNCHGAVAADYSQIDLTRFRLLGLREFGPHSYWVPCSSCMSATFSEEHRPSFPMVTYSHRDHDIPEFGTPRMSNDVDSVEEAVRFLASGKVVLTNSYHGLYWASLLGRRVLVWRPFSSRFFAAPWPFASVWTQEDVIRASQAEVPQKNLGLAEARAANTAFFEEVKRALCSS